MNKPIQIFRNISSISGSYDGILLDAYGVFWNGNATGLIPGAKEMMQHLVATGKIVGILSNSTSSRLKEINKLQNHGLLEGKHFHFLITSGETAKFIFQNEELPFRTPKKKFWVYCGDHPKFSSHQEIFQDTLYKETLEIGESDFIYIATPHINGEDQTNPNLFQNEVERLRDSNLPMVCANPDRFAHEGNPARAVVRPGSIAALYEKVGGEVFYIGKPFYKGYSLAMEQFKAYGVIHPEEVLMVGDTPETDIRGARMFGMGAALVIQTGITADRIAENGIEAVLNHCQSTDLPNFYIERLASLLD